MPEATLTQALLLLLLVVVLSSVSTKRRETRRTADTSAAGAVGDWSRGYRGGRYRHGGKLYHGSKRLAKQAPHGQRVGSRSQLLLQ
jgi:hypothetical protein